MSPPGRRSKVARSDGNRSNREWLLAPRGSSGTPRGPTKRTAMVARELAAVSGTVQRSRRVPIALAEHIEANPG
jgi:hypothetical protein